MSGIGKHIKKFLDDKKSFYLRLLSVLEEERDILKRSDLDALWKMNDAKNEIAFQIESARQDMIEILIKSGIKNNLSVKEFSLDEFLFLFENEDEYLVFKEAGQEITQIKTKVYNSQSVNRQFVEEYLGILGELVSVIANNGSNRTYSRKNDYPAKSGGLILNQEA
ncbi:MAG: flagellar export chaperone FlgN [Desulforegulaceae bacterium]|nr:flagellar export chaperone FlgN [Desulforegulaceae bacterium]